MPSSAATAPAKTARQRRRAAAAPARRAPQRSAAITTAIYAELRADIIAMRRMPGEPVVEKRIAEAFGVSRTPVRDALLRLADEGLIEIFPQSGTFVSRIPVDTLPEAIVIRTILERSAARFAAERATRSQVALLRANLELQHERAADDDREGFHTADEVFHALIAETAGLPGLWTLAQQIKVQVDRYRRLTLPEPGRIPRVIDEHAAIVDAIADHDPDRADACLLLHLEGLRASIPEARGSHPYFFSDAPARGATDAGAADAAPSSSPARTP